MTLPVSRAVLHKPPSDGVSAACAHIYISLVSGMKRSPGFIIEVGSSFSRSGRAASQPGRARLALLAAAARPMANYLLIGTNDKTEAALHAAELPFLLIDDGPIADAFAERFAARTFDPAKDSFNPLRGMTHRQAREFADILYIASPHGETTLTVRNGKRKMPSLLLENSRLDQLKGGADPGVVEAIDTINDLLFSPTLKRVLCRHDFHIVEKRSIIARLNRAALGDFDALVLGLLLISQTKGHQVIVPDGGFYLKDIHTYLVRQNRLTVGLNFLAELRKSELIQNAVVGIKDKIALRCTPEDAELLLPYFTVLNPEVLMRMDEGTYLSLLATSPQRWEDLER